MPDIIFKNIESVYYMFAAFQVVLWLLLIEYIYWEINRRYKENKIKTDPRIKDKEVEIAKIKKETADKFKAGLDKHSYVLAIINLIIASIAVMSFIQASYWGKEAAILNNKSVQVLQDILGQITK